MGGRLAAVQGLLRVDASGDLLPDERCDRISEPCGISLR